ncbi:hypothetical protein BH23BAC2_BH23BAC2_17790 [soil metagenome]
MRFNSLKNLNIRVDFSGVIISLQNKFTLMRKSRAIGLLKTQIEKIDDPAIMRAEWINTTSAVLTRIFPESSPTKIAQIKTLENMPEFYHDISKDKRIETDKRKAETFLRNYIEEIELLGTETSSKMEMFFGSFRFWSILITICILSFIGGSSRATGKEIKTGQSIRMENFSLNQNLLLQKRQIDSLKRVIFDLQQDL